jgi:hypothetical protein
VGDASAQLVGAVAGCPGGAASQRPTRWDFPVTCSTHPSGGYSDQPRAWAGARSAVRPSRASWASAEFIGSADGTAAPRLAETRPGPAELARLWDQTVTSLVALARGRPGARRPVCVQRAGPREAAGHDRPAAGGRRDRNPKGDWFLTRDAENIGRWFAACGLSGGEPGTLGPRRPARREAMLGP